MTIRAESVSPLIKTLLEKRGVKDIYKFLNPSPEHLSKTESLIDIDDALKIVSFIKNNKKILIYGDYDVDGVSSCAIFGRFLMDIDFKNFRFVIPNRFKDGYGLNIDRLRNEIEKEPFDMLITFDCGIGSVDAVKYLKEHSVFVVVTDHHLPFDKLPDADIIINPKIRKKEDDSDYFLCGCGISFKLIHALKLAMGLKGFDLKRYLDIVGLATVADVVPLVGDNRILVKYGLYVANSNPSIGIKMLKKIAGVKRDIKAYHHGFVFGPRINASGRMEIADKSLQLLTSNSEAEAEKIALELEELNRLRQKECDNIFDDALSRVSMERRGITLFDKGWNKGVVGIVASRLVERFNKPTILFGTSLDRWDDGFVISGSGRSTQDINLFDALNEVNRIAPGLMLHFGGHTKACGLSINADDFPSFANIFEQVLTRLPESSFTYKINYDLELSLGDVSIEFVKQISLLEPFGYGNETPEFLFKNVDVAEYMTIVNGKHLLITFTDGRNRLKGIWFNYPAEFQLGDKLDFIASLDINYFNGNEYVQLIISNVL